MRRLNSRETEVLMLVARGMNSKDIANALSISEHTVKNHLSNIFNKLGVDGRVGAVVKGLREGYISLDDIA